MRGLLSLLGVLSLLSPGSALRAYTSPLLGCRRDASSWRSDWEFSRHRLFVSPAASFEDSRPTFNPQQASRRTSPINWRKFLWNNSLLIGEFIVITIARLNPRIGMTGGPLRPEITISKLGVLAIFFINGIQLSLGANEDMHDMLKLNAFIQSYNMLLLPLLARLLAGHYPDVTMREGLMVCS